MSFNVSNLTNYFDRSTELLSTATLLSDDLARYRFEDDVQYSKKINTANVTMYAQAGTCGVSPSGTTTFDEATIEVRPISYNLRYCFEDLQEKGIRIERQAIAKGLEDQAVEDALTMKHILQIKSDNEKRLWAGDTDDGDLIDGWFTIAANDSDTLHIDPDYGDLVQSAITISNIGDYMAAFVDKIVETEAIWGVVNQGEKVTIHVSPRIYNIYKQYLVDVNAFRDADKDLAVKEQWLTAYEEEISIKEEPALAVSAVDEKPKILATYDSNLVYGSSMIDDVTAPRAGWAQHPVTDYVHFKSSFRLGATIIFPNAVVTNYGN